MSSVDAALPDQAAQIAPRLRVRVPPAPGESANGWRLRVSEANGFSQNRVLQKAYPEIGHVTADGPGGLRALASLCRCDEGCVSRLGPAVLPESSCSVPGRRKVGARVRDWMPKVCPGCLSEKAFLPWVWELEMWVGCPVHERALISDCEGCGGQLSWARSRVDRCCDAFPLAARRGGALSENSLSLLRVFASKADYPAPPAGEALQQLLAGTDLRDLSVLVKHLGLFAMWNGAIPKYQARKVPRVQPASEVFGWAADILCGWPGRFHDAIDRAVNARGEGAVKFRGALGRLFYILTRTLPGEGTAFVRIALEEHGRRKYGIFSTALANRDPRQTSLVKFQDARMQLGIAAPTLLNFLNSGFAAGEKLMVGARSRWWLAPSEIARLADVLGPSPGLQSYLSSKGAVSNMEASALLGVSSKTVASLIHAQMLAVYQREGRQHGVRNVSLITLQSLLGLLRRFSPATDEQGIPILASGEARSTDWKGISALRMVTGADMATTLATIERNGLSPVAFDPSRKGLHRSLFSLDAYRKAIARIADPSGMKLDAVMRVLAVSAPGVDELVNSGMLTVFGSNRKKKGRTIDHDSVGRFLDCYVTSGLLAREHKTAARRVNIVLRSQGLNPLLGCVWQRSQIAGLEQLLGKAADVSPRPEPGMDVRASRSRAACLSSVPASTCVPMNGPSSVLPAQAPLHPAAEPAAPAAAIAPSAGLYATAHGFGHGWRKRVRDLPVGRGLPSGERPAVGKALDAGGHP